MSSLEPDQNQDIQNSTFTNSDVQLGQAGGDLIQTQGNHNTINITNQYNQLFGRWKAGDDRTTSLRGDRSLQLLKKVQWEIQKRLEDTLNEDHLIPLSMQERLELVDRSPLKPRRRLQTADGKTTPLDLNESILEVFCQVRGKLLILGDPGAGKTTTLLTLALEIDSGLCRRGPLGRFIGYKAASYPSPE